MNAAQLMSSAFVVTWLSASLRLAGPVLLAALGETFAEQRSREQFFWALWRASLRRTTPG
jgi:hypothetical protein